ncbi:protein phosphatase 1F isoform X1 [Lingula anatina]|uniref:Protein phosphatase 1E n=1 Tax=Lingula anatina TaxID=7574 RepID=A0A2R2MRS3_LINAN|nr:protein phosphatase 1F isoform X1 [Lingula anatina]|eukprot:XP_023932955.1 protein phosphatase 1F isoform X1 [Lingula anatina]
MAKPGNASSYVQFLEEFCKEHKGTYTDADRLPIRIENLTLSITEVEGESLDLALQYLETKKCPTRLAHAIAHAVAVKMVKSDLSHIHSESSEDEIQRLDANSFGRELFNKVDEMCNQWLTHGIPELPTPSVHHSISVHTIKNTRRKMEDRHVIIDDLNSLFKLKGHPPQSYYAVFDGHGGTDAAAYAAAHVHLNIIQHPAFPEDMEKAMKEGYIATDEGFVARSNREKLNSGSTGVSVLMRGNKLHTAWLGDSQALLVRDGTPIQLMKPHKPEREDERKRIEGLGGCVIWFGAWRVNGALSVSRAIGDADHKPYVSGEPDVSTVQLDGTEDYIILACDGMWDTIPYNDLVNLIYEHFDTNKGTRDNIAEALVKEAKTRGSSDNISVIVVFLRDTVGTPKVEYVDDEIDEEESGNNGKKKNDINDKKPSDDRGKDNKKDIPLQVNFGGPGSHSSGGTTDSKDMSKNGKQSNLQQKKEMFGISHSKCSVSSPISSTTSSLSSSTGASSVSRKINPGDIKQPRGSKSLKSPPGHLAPSTTGHKVSSSSLSSSSPRVLHSDQQAVSTAGRMESKKLSKTGKTSSLLPNKKIGLNPAGTLPPNCSPRTVSVNLPPGKHPSIS